MEHIENVLSKRKEQYKSILDSTPYDYDVWFDYLRMLEQEGDESQVIAAYEKAVTNTPPSVEKRFWRRYGR